MKSTILKKCRMIFDANCKTGYLSANVDGFDVDAQEQRNCYLTFSQKDDFWYDSEGNSYRISPRTEFSCSSPWFEAAYPRLFQSLVLLKSLILEGQYVSLDNYVILAVDRRYIYCYDDLTDHVFPIRLATDFN